jgi:putative ATPase
MYFKIIKTRIIMNLFDEYKKEFLSQNAPLADRMRPKTLDEFVGQEHIIGTGRLLRRAIQIDQLSSIIFYGPPGTGKTTLARIIAQTTKADFISINAVLAGIKEIRDAIDIALRNLSQYSKRTILFIDEVHRFNKAQQDALLPHVENGVIILIGATTENPYFEVNKALLSRSRIFQLKPLCEEHIKKIAMAAISDKERGYGNKNVKIDDDALTHLVKTANGDARSLLNALELAVETTPPNSEGIIHITREVAEDSIQKKAVLYDKDGDAHYDNVSAFIKSIRGSDPDAALYWMAKMIYAGEDPRFIFRRMLILASEDIGMADPNALTVVMNAAQAFEYVGMPEGRYHLSHACLYLATAPKSNSTMAFFDALSTVEKEANNDVPLHLMDSSRDKNGFGHGNGYLYPHAYRDHWVAQQYLPSSLQGKIFYQPSTQGFEKQISIRVKHLREAMIEAMTSQNSEIFFDNSLESSKNLWIKRGEDSNYLLKIRNLLFDSANIKRDSLILDLHAGTGFITFEAMRRVLEGTIWTLAYNDNEYETIQKLFKEYDFLHRPVLLKSSPLTFDLDIINNSGHNIKFDIIIGRNIICNEPNKIQILSRAFSLLSNSGEIILAETVHYLSQRLYKLINFDNISKEIKDNFIKAEEMFFSDPNNYQASWTPKLLENECLNKLKCKINVKLVTDLVPRKISAKMIEIWFRPFEGKGNMSLGALMEKELGENLKNKIKSIIISQLANKIIQWETTSAILKITHK